MNPSIHLCLLPIVDQCAQLLLSPLCLTVSSLTVRQNKSFLKLLSSGICHSIEKERNTEIEKIGFCCDYLTMWLVGLWNCFVKGIWKNLDLWARKALECHKS